MEGPTGNCCAISAPASASSRFMEICLPLLVARRCCKAASGESGLASGEHARTQLLFTTVLPQELNSLITTCVNLHGQRRRRPPNTAVPAAQQPSRQCASWPGSETMWKTNRYLCDSQTIGQLGARQAGKHSLQVMRPDALTGMPTSIMSFCKVRVMKRKEGRSAGLCDQQACIKFCNPRGMSSGMGGR